ncbi:hypothetical protein VNO78_21180 [Psophocarpus tetragonolobus]|uniref:MADS-box domain-containing protein n=1 Tax=Psophocarpus tetragonolobus TaxID=3891 RepID=A0AAN9SAQ4_PSOTE
MDSKKVGSMNNGVIKKTKGRQKMEMKKMSNERNLQVTFSKRRNGVFKKASELATLCGVDIAVIMFSPGNQVFSFGSPSVDSVIQRYTTQGPLPVLTHDLNQAQSATDEADLHAHLNHLSHQIAFEKKRSQDLNHFLNATQDHFWWAAPIHTMNYSQCLHFKNMLHNLKTYINQSRKKFFPHHTSTTNCKIDPHKHIFMHISVKLYGYSCI